MLFVYQKQVNSITKIGFVFFAINELHMLKIGFNEINKNSDVMSLKKCTGMIHDFLSKNWNIESIKSYIPQ